MAELNVRYASALFDLALECGKLDEYFEQAVLVHDALQSDECRTFIEHPDISLKDKHKFLNSVFGEEFHDDLKGLLYLLIEKSRENIIIPVFKTFMNMADAYMGRTTAVVVSAVTLTEDQLSTLKDVLSKKLNKQVEISAKTDSSLIGGLYIHVDGYLIDHTVKKHLKDLKDSIKGGFYID